MTKLRTGEPWMPASQYSESLSGVSVNLLVRDVERALRFHRLVLACEVIYSDPDILVARHDNAQWIVHADHTYDAHPLHQLVTSVNPRGVGLEIRLHHHDPDAVQARAVAHGYEVVEASANKGHGLRECFVRDEDGYIWVPDRPLVE